MIIFRSTAILSLFMIASFSRAQEGRSMQGAFGTVTIDGKREKFTTDDIMNKEQTLRHMLKPNTWNEIHYMVEDAGFKTVEQFWRNHNFLGAIAIK